MTNLIHPVKMLGYFLTLSTVIRDLKVNKERRRKGRLAWYEMSRNNIELE